MGTDGAFLLITLAVFLNSIELSSQAQFIQPQHPRELPNLQFWEKPDGRLVPLNEGNFRLVADAVYIYGINVDGIIHPICDGHGQRVLVHIASRRNVRMTKHFAEQYHFDRPPWDSSPYHPLPNSRRHR